MARGGGQKTGKTGPPGAQNHGSLTTPTVSGLKRAGWPPSSSSAGSSAGAASLAPSSTGSAGASAAASPSRRVASAAGLLLGGRLRGGGGRFGGGLQLGQLLLLAFHAAGLGGGLLGLFGAGLGLLDDVIGLLLGQLAHRHQVVRLDDRQVVVAEEALLDQLLGDRHLEAVDRAETVDRPVDVLRQLLLGHDLDVPAGELARQADVLPATADGQAQVVLLHQRDRAAEHLAEDDLIDLRRLQRVGDQHLEVVVPADDVDPLARELVDDVLDPVAADADARPHAVDAGVAAEMTATFER